jgi:cellulase/cellobiase CelA1
VVDLRDAFRPFLDEAAAAPRRTVAEVAERAAQARRRRIRHRSAGAGLAAAVVAGALVLVDPFATPDRSSQVSVADDPAPTTTPTTSASPSTAPSTTAAPITEAPTTTVAPATTAVPTTPPADGDTPLVSLVDGVVATSTTTSSWDDGYCVEVRVENTTAAEVEWRVRSALGGTIATRWSATADDQGGGVVVFTGEEGYNRRLAPGASTTFGTCVDT